MNTKLKKEYFLPLILTLIVIVADQLTKWLVVRSIAPWSIGFTFWGDFLRIVCVYNTGAAFSLGSGLSSIMRFIVMACIPTVFIGGICMVYFKSDFTRTQRWFLSAVIGGGISNLLDRFLRAEGVVDFIDVKFYGLFGLERWPTFNVADSAIVIGALGLLVIILMQEYRAKKAQKHSSDGEQKNHSAAEHDEG